MSTKKIRELIENAGNVDDFLRCQLAEEAIAEVEAIEKACGILHRESIEDDVYRVRDRVAEDAAFTGNTWEHPRVVAFGQAAQVIANISRESK